MGQNGVGVLSTELPMKRKQVAHLLDCLSFLDVVIAATQPRNQKVTVFHNHCINQSRVVTYSPCLKL